MTYAVQPRIVYGTETFDLRPTGVLKRMNAGPTGELIVGAVTFDNFNRIVKRYSINDVLVDPKTIPWKHKNGKQKTFLIKKVGTQRSIWHDTHLVI